MDIDQNLSTNHRRAVVVTGATSGIGRAVAGQLAQQGIWVIGIGRSSERCREAEASLHRINAENKAIYLTANLSLQSEVRRLAAEIEEALTLNGFTSLYALVNNAGLFTYWQELTPEGFETQWATNHLAPFLLTNLLLPTLQAAPAARVVTVSSNSHYGARIHWDDVQLRKKYWGLTAYGQSKLANVLFTLELNKRLSAGSTLRAFACDPGLVKTDIGAKDAPAYIRLFWNVSSKSRGITAEQSARGITRVILEPSIQASEQIYWKHGQPVPPSKRALNEEDACKLWALSERMTGRAG